MTLHQISHYRLLCKIKDYDFTQYEERLVWLVLQKSFGCNRSIAWIPTLDDFTKLTGISRGNVSVTLKGLICAKVIEECTKGFYAALMPTVSSPWLIRPRVTMSREVQKLDSELSRGDAQLDLIPEPAGISQALRELSLEYNVPAKSRGTGSSDNSLDCRNGSREPASQAPGWGSGPILEAGRDSGRSEVSLDCRNGSRAPASLTPGRGFGPVLEAGQHSGRSEDSLDCRNGSREPAHQTPERGAGPVEKGVPDSGADSVPESGTVSVPESGTVFRNPVRGVPESGTLGVSHCETIPQYAVPESETLGLSRCESSTKVPVPESGTVVVPESGTAYRNPVRSVPESGTFLLRSERLNVKNVLDKERSTSKRSERNVVRSAVPESGTVVVPESGTPPESKAESGLRERIRSFVGERDWRDHWEDHPESEAIFLDARRAEILAGSLRYCQASLKEGVKVRKSLGSMLWFYYKDSLKRKMAML